MKPFTFVHLADFHLGYSQYNLQERREDFSRVFIEAVDRTLELNADFVVISGDLFDHPRPPNTTLATTIRELRRLKEAGVTVYAVEGSHDSEPNVLTGTVLVPLHNAGLIIYLPRLDGGSVTTEDYYIYGLRNISGPAEAERFLPSYLEAKPPTPKSHLFNIFAFHAAVEGGMFKRPLPKPDLPTESIPPGFQYYAGGHIHEPHLEPFKTGIMAYPGPLETTEYTEGGIEKGFFHVKVGAVSQPPLVERVKVTKARPFQVEERDLTGLQPNEIVERASQILRGMDSVEGSILALVLRGGLPRGVRRNEIDFPKIRSQAHKALYTIILNRMAETLPPTPFLSVGGSRELKAMAHDYFLKNFRDRFGLEKGVEMARTAVDLIDPLLKGDRDRVKTIVEG